MVRALAERVASARHRTFLISCRVPLSVERCLAIGLDVPAWLKDQGCPGGPEVDLMQFNGKLLGILTGANDSWSLSFEEKTCRKVRNTNTAGPPCWTPWS